MPSERFDQTQGVVAEKPDRAMLASINPSKRHEAGAETVIAPPIGCAESLLDRGEHCGASMQAMRSHLELFC